MVAAADHSHASAAPAAAHRTCCVYIPLSDAATQLLLLLALSLCLLLQHLSDICSNTLLSSLPLSATSALFHTMAHLLTLRRRSPFFFFQYLLLLLLLPPLLLLLLSILFLLLRVFLSPLLHSLLHLLLR